jgi:hypothetical protein
MSNSTSILIQTVTFGVPSGNYNGYDTTWYSNAIYGPGYYGYTGLTTVAYFTAPFNGNVMLAFVGDMNLQGTLASNPTNSDWADIEGTLVGNTDPNNPTPIATSINALGNFAYIRIKVSNFSAGSIIKVQASY